MAKNDKRQKNQGKIEEKEETSRLASVQLQVIQQEADLCKWAEQIYSYRYLWKMWNITLRRCQLKGEMFQQI